MTRTPLARRLAVATLIAAASASHAQTDNNDMARGRQMFSMGGPPLPACALCHKLQDAKATGAVGPDLDDLMPDAARVETALRNGMGPMPSFAALGDEQIRLLARYVAQAAGGRK